MKDYYTSSDVKTLLLQLCLEKVYYPLSNDTLSGYNMHYRSSIVI